MDNEEDQPSSFNDEAWKSVVHLGNELSSFCLELYADKREKREIHMGLSFLLLFQIFLASFPLFFELF